MTIFKNKRLLWIFLICLLGSSGTLRAEGFFQEYRVQVAFLVNFGRFITWPEQSFSSEQQKFTICVAGDNPFGTALSAAESKKINGRNVGVTYVDSLRKIPPCHLLYVSRSEKKNLDSLSSGIGRQAVVTVSDIPGFVKAGGSIEFVMKKKQLSFIINNSAMKQRGIRASSSMLNLAVSVR
jgi:YfiR/HmsC-like